MSLSLDLNMFATVPDQDSGDINLKRDLFKQAGACPSLRKLLIFAEIQMHAHHRIGFQ